MNLINLKIISASSDPTNKYINKLKRQERVIEEVKLAIKPHYSKRVINKEQYKQIMKKAVPKVRNFKFGYFIIGTINIFLL